METLAPLLRLSVYLIVAFGVGWLVFRFLLPKSHTEMDAAMSMQKTALDGQEEALELCRETLKVNKAVLEEIRTIRRFLDERDP